VKIDLLEKRTEMAKKQVLLLIVAKEHVQVAVFNSNGTLPQNESVDKYESEIQRLKQSEQQLIEGIENLHGEIDELRQENAACKKTIRKLEKQGWSRMSSRVACRVMFTDGSLNGHQAA
jgi:peptidoglycan hydrolase CwlO-like protein